MLTVKTVKYLCQGYPPPPVYHGGGMNLLVRSRVNSLAGPASKHNQKEVQKT